MSSSKARRRNLNPISLAFLDVMFCGFGAVILIFLILDHNSSETPSEQNLDLAAEVNLLREEVNEGELGLVALRNTFSDVSFEVVTAEGLARQIRDQLQTFLQELAALENSSVATEESIEQLRADVKSLEEELLRLQASAFEQEGNSVRQFLGDGNRQYLSGLFLGGQRILILVDSSASMLDSTLVNIISGLLKFSFFSTIFLIISNEFLLITSSSGISIFSRLVFIILFELSKFSFILPKCVKYIQNIIRLNQSSYLEK